MCARKVIGSRTPILRKWKEKERRTKRKEEETREKKENERGRK